MPLCATCTHEDRDAIDRALVGGASVRGIAGRHSLSKSRLDRHKAHIPETLVRAHESHEDARAQTLCGHNSRGPCFYGLSVALGRRRGGRRVIAKITPRKRRSPKIATAIDGWAVPRLAPTMKGGDP